MEDREIARLAADLNARSHDAALSKLKDKYNEALDRLQLLEQNIDLVQMLKTARPPRALTIKRESKRGTEANTAVIVLTDWHGDQRVTPSEVGYLNEYNATIRDQRLEKCLIHSVRLIELWREIAPIDTLIIAYLGDGFSGHIHEELKQTTWMAPPEASVWLHDALGDTIATLERQKFKRIEVICKYGNHTRTTKEIFYSKAAVNNYEWCVCKMLANNWKGKAHWTVEEDYFTFINIYGKRVRLHHGNGAKYNGGIGGLSIPLNRSISVWNRSQPAYIDIIGHWHKFNHSDTFVSIGSLIGHDPFARAKFAYEPPAQGFLVFSPDRALVCALPIFVD